MGGFGGAGIHDNISNLPIHKLMCFLDLCISVKGQVYIIGDMDSWEPEDVDNLYSKPADEATVVFAPHSLRLATTLWLAGANG